MSATVFIDLRAISENVKIINELCKMHSVSITAVTKGILADEKIVRVLINNGINNFADSRLANLKRIRGYDESSYLSLLRSPEIGEIEEAVIVANCSFNSEISTISRISEMAVIKDLIHDIVLMFDLGDRREGFLPSELESVIDSVSKMKNIKICGIGTNLGCISGMCYTREKMEELCNLAGRVEELLGKNIEIVSGGSTTALNLLYDGQVPGKVNNYRIGTALFLGSSQAGLKIPGLDCDAFVLEVEIIEIKRKPSVCGEEIAQDAFGRVPIFEDKGEMLRAILSIGRQDVLPESLKPKDSMIRLIGSSSDHMVLDVTNTEKNYKVGDRIRFNLNYAAMLYLMNSGYVNKVYKNGFED